MKKLISSLSLLFLLTFFSTMLVQHIAVAAPQNYSKPEALFNIDTAKRKLHGLVDRLKKELEQITTRINSLPKGDDKNGPALLNALENYSQKILSIQNAITASHDQSTLQAQAQQLRQILDEVRQQVKKYLGFRLQQHIQNFEQKKEQILRKMQEKLQRLKTRGINITPLQANFQHYTSAIDKATSMLDQARAQFQQLQNFNTDHEVTPFFRTGIELIHQGRLQFQKARPFGARF